MIIFDWLSIWLIAWILTNAITDTAHAIKGTENPRYELKRQKALAAGKRPSAQPRYGSRDWLGDLVSDGLVAQTERRRAKAAEKAKKKGEQTADPQPEVEPAEQQPVDEMVDVAGVRAPVTQDPSVRTETKEFPNFQPGNEEEWLTPAPDEHLVGPRPVCGRCGRGRIISYRGNGDELCGACGWKFPEVEPGGQTAAERNGGTVPNAPHIAPRAVHWSPSPDGPFPQAPTLADEVTTRLGGQPHRCPRCKEGPSQDERRPLCAGCQLELDALYAEAVRAVADLDPEGTQREQATAEVIAAVNAKDRYGWQSTDVTDFVHLAQLEAAERKAATSQDRPDGPTDTRPIAPVIPLFPNPQNTVKEIIMATSEVNGLTAALAFAQAAADAHASFASGGSEGYTGALVGFQVGDGCVSLAREAQEASQIAAAKWAAHVESLEAQLKVKEAYQGTPDAGNKTFLLNG